LDDMIGAMANIIRNNDEETKRWSTHD